MKKKQKNDEKLLSFLHRAKMEYEKFNRFFVDFLRYSFGRKKVITIVVEREDLLCISIDWFLYDKRFY